MEHDRIICLDIETIPDRTLIPEWNDGKFPPKPIWHQIVAISFVEARIEYDKGLQERYAVECCDPVVTQIGMSNASFRNSGSTSPNARRVVSWNGKGFDLPVLRARAMVYGISAQSWYQRGTKWDSYMQRFAPDWNCDLMEQLSDYRACASMSLDDVALALGLPGKIGGHGSEVEAMFRRGEIDKVRAYCEGDCLNLFVW